MTSNSDTIVTRRRLLAGGAAGVAAVTSGCTGITDEPQLENLEVQLSGIREPDVGLQKFTLPLELAFTNTGENRLPGVALLARTHINDSPVGRSQASVGTVSAGDTEAAILTSIVRYGDVADSVIDALKQGSFRLAIRGEIQSDGLLIDASRDVQLEMEVG